MTPRQTSADRSADEVRTTCPYCGVGCGIVVSRDAAGEVQVRGDPQHPANLGRLCSKGSALGETLGLQGRLLQPMVDGDPADWDTALDTLAGRLRTIIDRHGPDAVAFYVSGQLLTEDYYVANKLMKGFIGSANIDTNSRLCMSSAVAAYRRAFGSDTVPTCYQDIELADLVVLTGSNLAWCHPVLYQRLLAARQANPRLKVVVIDPRRTASCDAADLHLALRSGTDAVLFNGLLTWLHGHGHADDAYVRAFTEGVEAALHSAGWYAPTPQVVAQICGIDSADVERFYHWFGTTERVVTLFSQGINQSSSGTDKGNAIINCHLLTGRIGKPGAGPFSITGQPNAMGGREVGGLANQLAAHMDITNPGHRALVGRFWGSDRLPDRPGLKAIDLFQAIDRGAVKAVWIMATNPAVSLPAGDLVRRALQRCDCVVVSDCVADTDTLRYADIRLPALAWGEKDGTVTNSERRISRQRAFLPVPGEARPDWWILAEVAKRLGFPGFDYRQPSEVFAEHARLAAFENDGSRDFDLSALADLDESDYQALQPIQWPAPAGSEPPARLFGQGGYFTPSGRARFVAVTPRPPARPANRHFPLILNTGRVRDQWHSMTRTGRSARLSGHVSEPFVAVNPSDAAMLGLTDGGLARVEGQRAGLLLRVQVTDDQPAGQVFAPIHWNDQFAAVARVGALIDAAVDPHSGQPEFKHTPVRLVAYAPAWWGFLLTRSALSPRQATYWSKAWREGVWHYELAGERAPPDWAEYARHLVGEDNGGAAVAWRELQDSTQSSYRGARIVDDRLDAVLMIGAGPGLPPRDWLVRLFAEAQLDDAQRRCLLRGVPAAGQADAGPTVCSCFGVGLNTLVRAIRDQGLVTPEAVGAVLGAGTNCGSCLPEVRRLLAQQAVARPA